MTVTEESFLNAVSRRGCIARDVRDAAHEAAHALDVGLRVRWTRDRVHDALVRKFTQDWRYIRSEVEARAIEQIVCTRLAVVTKPVEYWADRAVMESGHFGEKMLPYDKLVKAINMAIAAPDVIAKAERVLALGEVPS